MSGDLEKAVQQLKREPLERVFAVGLKLPRALAELGLIGEYGFVVRPRLVNLGPSCSLGCPTENLAGAPVEVRNAGGIPAH